MMSSLQSAFVSIVLATSAVLGARVASADGREIATKAKVGSSMPTRVKETALAHVVEKRRPVGEALAFAPGDTVHALAVLENPVAPTTVEMFWKRDGELRSRVKLDVRRGKGWRTWSRHRLASTDLGMWTVEIRNEDGTLLEELAFEVLPSLTLPQVSER
jgi:hypothetical protein